MMHNEEKPIRTKKAWPTKAAMEQVYEMKLWGGDQADFYSGTGSHDPELVAPYLRAVTAFLTSFEPPLVVCDLGCGDFNIGKELVPYTKKYVAVDIVSALIARNKAKFKAENLVFHCLDIAVDDLPSGDCAVLRQVLQHLSNAEVQSILLKLKSFQYAIITEHLPEGNFEPNKEQISGQGTRLKKRSGLHLTKAPFHFKITEEIELVRVVPLDGTGVIVTTLYSIF